MATWIGKPSVVEIDSVEQLPLEEATGLLATGDDPICFCFAELTGPLRGELIVAFDDASGWALCDMILGKSASTTIQWTEMAMSAALETTNILCCAYLNSLSRSLSESVAPQVLLPTPPRFHRDFAESLLEFALMGQAMAGDHVVLARTRFEINAEPVNWTLLFVPDADSMLRLRDMLPVDDLEH